MACTTPCQRQKSHPGKQQHRRLWTASCILARRFPGFQSQPGRGPGKLRHPRAARALFVGRVALPRGRRRVAAPDAAVVMATSASAIGPARPHYVAPWRREAVGGGGGRLASARPSSGCCESKACADSPQHPILPALSHPGCAGGKKPRGGPRYQRGRRPRPTWRPWGLDDLAGSWAWCEPCCARGPSEPAAVTPHPLLPPQRRSPPPPGNVTRPSI